MSFITTFKEVIRHFIPKTGLTKPYLFLRRVMGQRTEQLRYERLQDRFSTIYKNEVWRYKHGSSSGFGSDLQNTLTIREDLPTLLKTLGTETLLDLGCGDFTWMKEIIIEANYVGIDIVETVISTNIANYSNPSRSFNVLDATQDQLPIADTILCREVLFHLSFTDIWRVLENVRRSGAKYFLATSDGDTQFNADVLSGDFRRLNLLRAPFNFPEPIFTIQDNAVSAARRVYAWEVKKIPQPVGRNKCIN